MKNRYWRYFPEMERFADDAAQKAAWKRASSETIRRPAYWAAMLLPIVGSVLLVRIVATMGLLGWMGHMGSGALTGALGGLIGGSIFWLFRGSVTQSLRRQLNESGLPTCMKCGYDLRGCTEGRCSECGAQF